jgi:hypothetical protein|tara:strand:+ start:155 stop:496 length:342 start_codon:yes stop_codon:yes gene_type:complete
MVKELNNTKNKNVVKRGRPKGSVNKHKISLVNQVNIAIEEAVNHILPEKHNTTLADILADSLKANPTATITAISRFVVNPNLEVNIINNPFTEALQTINDRITIINNDIDGVQ